MLSVESQHRIEELLLEGKLMSQADLETAKVDALKASKPLIAYIAEKNLVGEEDLTRVSAGAMGVPYVNLNAIVVPEDITKLVAKETAETYLAVPFGMQQGRLAVGMLDPTNIQAVDFLSRKMGRPITTYLASRGSIDHVLAQFHNDVAADVASAMDVADVEDHPKVETKNAKEVANLVQDAPITRALNAILDYAAQSRASDIHIEPREKELKIRYRIDGILQETMTLPKSIEPALISRIKILSNLRIDEHRIPQDGQFQISSGGREIDLRIAISPVVWGEQVVIRLLDKTGTVLTLESLGFRGRAARLIGEGIHRPHGMTLSTGPTGSGKSTTLYAVVQELKDVSINIVTLEDPVEYKMDGINQIQVNGDVGLTFASGLRSILRQDPNVVLVGEIRDKETADLAVQAALTGHVVLSTIHTNSAAGVLPRMLDMGIEPFLIASTINTVIGQRLVRKLCEKCKESFETNEAQTKSVRDTLGMVLPKTKSEAEKVRKDVGYDVLPLADEESYTMFKAVGCRECSKGYKGRIGIYEVFSMTTNMEKLLLGRATTSEVQEQASKDGMLTMKQDGYFKALNALTTLEEVARVASDF
ncbi:MAG TPA: GspE/PulE family protein [Candidatus Saccharimonadia bacterium]|nr:GspE/PulE family protein [Candidatus Saccharimonadia bacterium]